MERFHGCFRCFCLVFGSLLTILFNFISLKMYSLIRMPMYLFFPSMALLIPIAIATTLPMWVAVYERDVEVHAKLKYYAHQSSNVKLLSRQLRELSGSGGISNFTLFTLNKSCTPGYFSVTVDYTITEKHGSYGVLPRAIQRY